MTAASTAVAACVRHGRRAYIRSVYFLPTLATLGNAICGFAAIYISRRSNQQPV